MMTVLTGLATEHDWEFVVFAGAVCLVVSLTAVSLHHRALSRRGSVLLDVALNNMSYGLMMFDAQGGLLLFNQRYLDLYRLPRGSLKLGMTLRNIIDLRIANGAFDLDADEYCRSVLSSIARGETSKRIVEMDDGRTIAVVGEPLASGGWVATHQDTTEERRREESFRFLFDENPLPMWVWDHATLRFLAVNNAALAQYGYTRERFLELTLQDIKQSPDWTSVTESRRGEDSVLREGRTSVHVKADGTLFDVEFYGRSITYEGRAASLIAIIDVTERKRAEGELKTTREFLNTIVENMPAMLLVKDANSLRYVLANRAAEKVYGVPSEDIIGKRAEEVFPDQSRKFIAARDQALLDNGEMITVDEQPFETRSGTKLLASKKLLVRDPEGRPQYILSLSEDVTDRKRARDQIAHMTLHDTLTDLPNRAAFNTKLAATLESASATDRMFAVLSIDLDRFKELNDVFGQAAGDALLCEVARRLGEAAGSAYLARLGGDEFALIIAEGLQPSTAEALAERLLQSMAADIAMDGTSLHVGMSVGVAVYPSDGMDATVLLANANAALYRAKAAGRGTMRFFEAHMDDRLRERRALQHELRTAIEQDELALHYQPQARISGEIIGFEALVRWHHPVRGIIAPGTFIPLAEESGLIIPMGEWILREACREAASWPRPLQVAVNLSPIQFRHGDLPSLVHAILLETGLAPHRLELEVTEGVLINDFTRAVSILRRLKLLGVSIAMDDFGTGYSSLSYLQSFPFDKIKIDRTFIANLSENHYSATIVRAVIGLGRGLHLPVMAEGVETAEQLAFLARENCDEVQGYYIGRPAPIETHAEMIGRRQTSKFKVVAG